MLKYVAGNILASECQVLLNPVNCVGVMGSGLAKQFANKFPIMLLEYKDYCKEGKLEPGNLHIWHDVENNQYIVNFPTKLHYRNLSKLEYIDLGLKALSDFILEKDVKSVSIPALGCGLGGLDWESVKTSIEEWYSAKISDSVQIQVYLPN